MGEAFIVGAVRTPVGTRKGALAGVHPADLGAHVLAALVERTGVAPETVEDVIMGCVTQVGPQSLDLARTAWLSAGLPESTPGVTIDRQCGSSQQSAHFAAQAVMAGVQDVVVAAGVEVMSQVPMGASVGDGKFGFPFGPRVASRYEDVGGLVPQGISAELIADKWGISREDLDAFALSSQERAARARDEGRFENEIIAVTGFHRDKESGEVSELGEKVSADEGIRESTLESLAKLKPSFKEDGKVTAANSSQITDGASASLIMSEQKANELGLRPRARFHAMSVVGVDPVLMLTGPIPATQKVLDKAGLSVDDIDLFEVNEAFASVLLAWEKEIGADMDKVNVNGGAIALGHPLGASGTKLLATLLNELERTGGRWGLQTMCEGGGMANATILELLA